ncbi:bestrophin family protein [Pseudomonas sp. UYIF39]|jgi:predicted membrane chloride channel (bestrophin family)|uniref:bestrophin family ion channel n=1 Tax=Pseudomonas sp. UYIF39 TaxID=1630747 RepID=UPI00249E7F2B|nr:bestrophin family ion channel [Pseudomonas sp. UYIF39]MDI3357190.1 bestrophin family protein [Pseudomonas sp. UYIF39]
MIVRPKPNLIGVLTSLKGSIAKRIAWRSLLVTLLASAIVLIETLHPSYFSKVSATPFTLLGLSLSIFMSFRNNACYDRWYEARKAWGDELEDPFGRDENDLPTDALVRSIERDVLAALGVTQLPPQLEPVDYVLN